MNLSLFKETVSQYSFRLKEENTAEFKLDSAINKASYYNQVALDVVNDHVSLFKEKLVREGNMSDKLFKEGLADVGKAIWSAIVKVLQQIVRVAVNVRMWVNGGEKSLFKRIDKVIARINSKEEFTGYIALPILKGDTGMKGYYNTISVMANLLSGKAYENCSLNGDTLEWREINSSSSLLGVISSNTRAVASATKGAKLDTTDIKAMQTDLMKLNKSASKGINKQLLKSVGGADKLKDIYKVTRLNHITKTSATQAMNALKTYITKAFDKSEFEKTLNSMLKDTKGCLKGGKGSLTVELQGMAKVSLQTINVLLNDYLNMVKDIKLALLDIMQSIEKGGSDRRMRQPKNDERMAQPTASVVNKIIAVPYFVESCDKQDKFAVKSVLADMVARVNGDKKQLDEAIKYAEAKGAFEWETYDEHESSTVWDSINEEYNFEKERLVQNFCEERYHYVLKLYKQR